MEEKQWGFLENNYLSTNIEDNYEESVPSDWSATFFYHLNKKRFWTEDTSIVIKSWVSEFVKSDQERIKNDWQPTAGEWIDHAELARIAEEEKIKA